MKCVVYDKWYELCLLILLRWWYIVYKSEIENIFSASPLMSKINLFVCVYVLCIYIMKTSASNENTFKLKINTTTDRCLFTLTGIHTEFHWLYTIVFVVYPVVGVSILFWTTKANPIKWYCRNVVFCIRYISSSLIGWSRYD